MVALRLGRGLRFVTLHFLELDGLRKCCAPRLFCVGVEVDFLAARRKYSVTESVTR